MISTEAQLSKDEAYRQFRNFVFCEFGKSRIYDYGVTLKNGEWEGRLTLIKDGNRMPLKSIRLFNISHTDDGELSWEPID